MSIEQKIDGNVGKLFLSDEIDLDKSPMVRENIKQLIDQVKTIEIQLSKVKYIDSSGIAALVEGMQLSKSNSILHCPEGFLFSAYIDAKLLAFLLPFLLEERKKS